MMEADCLCEYLDWDSDFFGRKIARVTVNCLTPETIEPILMWCNTRHIDCLYLLGDALDADTVRLAEDNRFHFVDIRVTLEKNLDSVPDLGDKPAAGIIRPCLAEDIPALRALAKTSHHDSRFYYDSGFPQHLCDALYETWIEKSCNGYADTVLVAELQGQPVGYVSCHLLDQAKGQIGLAGISAASQGKGIGQGLVTASLYWFREHGITQVSVVTQGRNCNAQRLYQRSGFLTRSVQLWYHRWFQPKTRNE